MSTDTMSCPHCGEEIKLTESLAAPMVAAAQKDFEKKLALKDKALAGVQESWAHHKKELEAEKAKLNESIEAGVAEARAVIVATENKKARVRAETHIQQKNEELNEIQAELDRNNAKLAEAQKAQAETVRKQRELDEKKREMDLTIDKSISDGLASARASALEEAEKRVGLTVREKEATIDSMKTQIEELRRKAEQGSQQLQGEVLELHLEEAFKGQFPDDDIVPVPKGVHGGDVVHSVVSRSGKYSGVILWEMKRTKTWSNTWLTKLRDDQREAKADIAVIVTQTMPKGVETFELMEGVWVCSIEAAIPIASVLRHSLLNVALARSMADGMQTKAEEVYAYLTGPQFKRRVEAIVEAFTAMSTDLEKEKKAITKQWSKREQQLNRMMTATTGMSGDLQGLAGDELEEVEGLDMKALAS
jgi:hypothetical protein